MVHAAARNLKRNFSERESPVFVTKNGLTHIAYFSTTLQTLEADRYSSLTQGMLLLDELNIVFTIRSKENQDSIVNKALDMLINMRRPSNQHTR